MPMIKEEQSGGNPDWLCMICTLDVKQSKLGEFSLNKIEILF
jgi:hypothetical protein